VNKENFVQKVEFLCRQQGINPTTACVESGVGRSLLSEIKRGSAPSVTKIEKLAAYLGTTVSDLLGEQEGGPSIISDDEAALDEELIRLLCQLTAAELEKVDAFVKGLLAAR